MTTQSNDTMQSIRSSIASADHHVTEHHEESHSAQALSVALTCIHSFDNKNLVPDTVRAGLHGLRAEVTARFPDIADIAADDDGSWIVNSAWEVKEILDTFEPAYAPARRLVSAAADSVRDTPFAGYTDDYWQHVVYDLDQSVWNVLVYSLNTWKQHGNGSRTENAAMLMILSWVIRHDRLAEYVTSVLQSMFVIEQYHITLTVSQRTDIVRDHVLNALYRTMEAYDHNLPFPWQSPLLVTQFVEHCADGELFAAGLYDAVSYQRRFKHHHGLQQLRARVERVQAVLAGQDGST